MMSTFDLPSRITSGTTTAPSDTLFFVIVSTVTAERAPNDDVMEMAFNYRFLIACRCSDTDSVADTLASWSHPPSSGRAPRARSTRNHSFCGAEASTATDAGGVDSLLVNISHKCGRWV